MNASLLKRFAIALLFTVGLVRWAAADSINGISAQIKSDRTWVLIPDKTQFQWDNWDVTIEKLFISENVQKFRVVTAPTDSVFVCLNLTVKNNSHSGKAFIPQNDLKLVLGNNEFDAADLDCSGDEPYYANIEPTLTRSRKCYFEVPKALLRDAFTIRFAALFVAETRVSVRVNYVANEDNGQNNQAALVAAADAHAAAMAKLSSDPFAPTIERAESQLRRAWNLLSPTRKATLRYEQERWTEIKDSSNGQIKLQMIRDRILYLLKG
jgi:hypothetical protein